MTRSVQITISLEHRKVLFEVNLSNYKMCQLIIYRYFSCPQSHIALVKPGAECRRARKRGSRCEEYRRASQKPIELFGRCLNCSTRVLQPAEPLTKLSTNRPPPPKERMAEAGKPTALTAAVDDMKVAVENLTAAFMKLEVSKVTREFSMFNKDIPCAKKRKQSVDIGGAWD